MKSFYFLVTFLFVQNSFAQEFTTEKSIFSGQIGFFGAWVNNESRISNQFTLKSEIGLDIFSRQYGDGIKFD